MPTVEIVKMLRALWRRRILVALVALAAIITGLLLTYRVSLPPESRRYEVAIATARMLVDTPRSQVVDISPRGSETLGLRASLIANLMAEGEVKAAIARRAGLRPKQLLAIAEDAIEPATVTPKQARDPDAHLLTVGVVINPDGVQLPLIKIDAQAPDTRAATKLADAAVTGMSDYLDSKAAAEQISDARRLRVSGVGAPQTNVQVRGPGRMITLVLVFFIFLTGCAVILGASALARGWRQVTFSEAGAFETAGAGAAPLDDFVEDDALDLFGPSPSAGSESDSTELWADMDLDGPPSELSTANGDSSADRKARAKSA